MSHTIPSRTATLILAATLATAAPFAQAEMVTTEHAVSSQQVQEGREKIRAFLDRAEMRDRLQAMGVNGALAQTRVDALSDDEVMAMSQRIDALPAGGFLGSTDVVIILLVAILVVLAV
ncbi:MAG: PA2779 family protein [Burkholderiales bacterium]|nr:PA2779 family protein [Burkholderiales bacterium]